MGSGFFFQKIVDQNLIMLMTSFRDTVESVTMVFFQKDCCFSHTVLHGCNSEQCVVVGGDFNWTENPSLDRNHQEPQAASKRSLIRLTESLEKALRCLEVFFHQKQRQ